VHLPQPVSPLAAHEAAERVTVSCAGSGAPFSLSRTAFGSRCVSSAAGNSFHVGFFCPLLRFTRSDFSAARISQRREFRFRVERAGSLLGQAQLQAPLIPAPVSQQVRLFFPLLFLVRWQGIGDVFVSCAPLIQYPIEL
jgi:hypothetical protein